MSAYIAAVYPDRVEVLSDSAILNNDYRVSSIVPKVVPIDGVPMVITARGSMLVLAQQAVFIRQLAACGSVDAVMAGIAEELPKPSPFGLPSYPVDQDILIAGWSETMGPFIRHAFLRTDDLDVPLSVLTNPGEVSIGSTFTADDFYEANLYMDMLDDGLTCYGPTMMEAFRRKPVFTSDRPDRPVFGIGGQLMLSTIYADRVDLRSLGYWPDEIGRVIDPDARFASWTVARKKSVTVGGHTLMAVR